MCCTRTFTSCHTHPCAWQRIVRRREGILNTADQAAMLKAEKDVDSWLKSSEHHRRLRDLLKRCKQKDPITCSNLISETYEAIMKLSGNAVGAREK